MLRVFCVASVLLTLLPASVPAGDAPPQVIVDPGELNRVRALAKQPAVKEAFRYIESITAQLQDQLIELTEIPAPPFEESERARRFAEMLLEAGLTDVHIDDEGNVVGTRAGRTGNRVIAYTAHLDTVFPADTNVTVRRDGDTFHAPGIGDNTRGLIVLLAAQRALEHAGIETDADILFVGNVGEEGLGDLRGMKYLFRDGGPRIDAMIAVDGGDTSRLIYGGVGSHRYRVTFRGPGGHSWGAFGRASPHHALGRAIDRFVTLAPVITSEGEKTSFNIGRIGGGTSVNSIAFESWMEVDLRSVSQDKLDAIDAVLHEAVQEALIEENDARAEGDALTVTLDRIGTRPAARGEIDGPLVQAAAAAMRTLGVEPELQLSSTDANHPLSIGVPAITMSRGGKSENSHAPNESWQDIDSHIAIQIGLLTLLAEANRP